MIQQYLLGQQKGNGWYEKQKEREEEKKTSEYSIINKKCN